MLALLMISMQWLLMYVRKMFSWLQQGSPDSNSSVSSDGGSINSDVGSSSSSSSSDDDGGGGDGGGSGGSGSSDSDSDSDTMGQ